MTNLTLGRTDRYRPRKKRHFKVHPLIWIAMWGYAAISAVPLLIMFLNSFRSSAELIANPWPFTTSPTIENYVNAWTQASFATYVGNSVIVTVGAVVLSTAVSLPAAYALSRWQFVGNRLLQALFISGLMVPMMLAILPIFYLMDSLNLIDSPLSLILIYGANGVPFSIFVLSAFFRQLPVELEEAASIDGSGYFRTFLQVMLPLVWPAVATVAVFRFVPIWNEFLMPLVLLRSRENYTISVGLTTFFSEYETDRASLFAGLVIATIPLLILFILATKQIVQGLTAGLGK
ncbi:carbohydrate ABC transporter permease [Salinibacterium sp. G-O1]|uniref:carbohydrate ABC transporter permease n=1 Tax=Salinibacterium sp. G-O1 TaxID=3046208 RepID=UPI0024B9F8AF|nr:carbohydrate ABC transporter permease [Salinibacterium sp. G-O1]MDJ0334923.1 carbohydrate ABC transporter permease [Salinibacterium sp. G-O1]